MSSATLLSSLRPVVASLFAARYEVVVALEVVSTADTRQQRKVAGASTSSHPQHDDGAPSGRAAAAAAAAAATAATRRMMVLLAVTTPMEGTRSGAGGASTGSPGGPMAPSISFSKGALHSLEVKSNTQVRLRHSLPLVRMASVSRIGHAELTFDFAASGMFTTLFESSIQCDVFLAAVRKLQGGGVSVAAAAASATASAAMAQVEGGLGGDAAAAGPSSLFDAVEQEEVMDLTGEALDNAQRCEAALAHQQKTAELQLTSTLVESSGMWKEAREKVVTLINDVEAVEQRIALHTANLLEKQSIIEQVEHQNNSLQRKKENLNEVLSTVERLRGLLQLDPEAEECLHRLHDTPEGDLPQFFDNPANVELLSSAMKHMHDVIQDAQLLVDFPIAAVRERKKWFADERRFVVVQSKVFLFAAISKQERRYLMEDERRSSDRILRWRLHDGLCCELFCMRGLLKATEPIDVEGYISLVRHYRGCVRRVYSLDFAALYHSLDQQLLTAPPSSRKRFRLGRRLSDEEVRRLRAETLSPGDDIPSLTSLPLPSASELSRQSQPEALEDGDMEDDDDGEFSLPYRVPKPTVPGPGVEPGVTILPEVKPASQRLQVDYRCPILSVKSVTTSSTSSETVELLTALQTSLSSLEVFSSPKRLRKLAGEVRARPPPWLSWPGSRIGGGSGGGSCCCGSSGATTTSSSASSVRRGSGHLPPDITFAIAMQCTLQAVLLEEAVLREAFGVSSVRQEFFFMESLLEILGGDPSSLFANLQLFGERTVERMSRFVDAVKLPGGNNRSPRPQGEGGIDEGFRFGDEDEEEEARNTRAAQRAQEMQQAIRRHTLHHRAMKLTRRMAEQCCGTYVIPILCMIQYLKATFANDKNSTSSNSNGETDINFNKNNMADDKVAAAATTASSSSFALVLLRDVESVMAGALMSHIEEQRLSIERSKADYLVHSMPLLSGFVNLPLYVYRMEALLHRLAVKVCDATHYQSMLTRVASQLFSALDEVTLVSSSRSGDGDGGDGDGVEEAVMLRAATSRGGGSSSGAGFSSSSGGGGGPSFTSQPHAHRGLSRFESIRRYINLKIEGNSNPGSLQAHCLQQYRHHAYFTTFYQTLSPLSMAVTYLKPFYDFSKSRLGHYEALYLSRCVMVHDFPVFGSFIITAEDLLKVYSPEELRHHHSMGVSHVSEVLLEMEREIPKGVHRSADRMRLHFLRDVAPDSPQLDFHRTLLLRTWQHFCRYLEAKMDLVTTMTTSWSGYEGLVLSITKEKVVRLLQEV